MSEYSGEQTDEDNVSNSEDLTIVSQFEDLIPDDSMVVDIKINLPDYNGENGIALADSGFAFMELKQYIQDLGCKILFSTAGIHLNGKSKVAHIHYNMITSFCFPPSNPSQHRSRWIKKNNANLNTFTNVSFKFHQKIDTTTPKYSVLSYPLKEGKKVNLPACFVFDEKPMAKRYISFLHNVGKAIYEKQCGLRLRQDKSEERKNLALDNLYQLCVENKDMFSNYREMVVWLDTNFIAKLELKDYPDPKNYKTNCQKICVKLGKLKYSDIL